MEPDELTLEEELEELGYEIEFVIDPDDSIFTDDDIEFLEEFDRTIANGDYPNE
jgi:hypothetical protein